MIPNFASAVSFNNLIKAYNFIDKTLDIAQSVENYCTSFDDEDKPIKLNYGLSLINSNNQNLYKNAVNFGKGLIKISNYQEVPNENDNQFGYTIDEIYEHTDDLSNCYVLGALFLKKNDENFELINVPAKYINDIDGSDVILSKDVDIKIVEDILKFSNEIVFPSPTFETDESLLIYKWIIDIEKYIDDPVLDRYSIYFYDLRQPEGLFGLSDEILYNNMIVNIINGKQQINNLKNLELNIIKDVIQKYIDLDGWQRNFIDYWTFSDAILPQDLREFIYSELGIVI